ncbi:MAG: L-serine ammonia-lyase [Hyphomonadaceae bacterium]|nr:L-serine ammonia-lyase [Hyphomonadaceae bacterium]
MLSVLDLFRVGLGPSSSHTVGPMRIAKRFLREARKSGLLATAARIEIELQGSLALTGVGHGTDKAVILGLLGFAPESAEPEAAEAAFQDTVGSRKLRLLQGPEIQFNAVKDIVYRGDLVPELHPNGMVLRLYSDAASSEPSFTRIYYSTGGGFISSARRLARPTKNDVIDDKGHSPYAFGSAAELLSLCKTKGLAIDELVLTNEDQRRPREKTLAQLDFITDTMLACIERGLVTSGILPGGLHVQRRAPDLYRKLKTGAGVNEREALFDWLNVYAMAVNEENAAGGRVVTAPTNGAAGILPAVLRHYCCTDEGEPIRSKSQRFLLVSGGIGLLYKQRASISGAEMGCQGEVGVACSMVAGGLAAVWGANPAQCLAAAEIGMEHNLGLTCDPVGGLVQIPCIERNAIGTVKAVNAARLALHQSGAGKVSLDQVIETMRQTGLDMSSKYKETSEGGLAVNVVAC